jgi:hypothetical protein
MKDCWVETKAAQQKTKSAVWAAAGGTPIGIVVGVAAGRMAAGRTDEGVDVCMRAKGYEIRQMTPEQKKRLLALDVPSRQKAAGLLATTGDF